MSCISEVIDVPLHSLKEQDKQTSLLTSKFTAL